MFTCLPQCSSAQQTVELLRQDKGYLTGRVNTLTSTVASAEEKMEYLREQLSQAKLAKESLYQQILADKLGCPPSM